MVTLDEVLEVLGDDAALAPLVHELALSRTMPRPRRFGSDALKVNGAAFAMVVRQHLVVKLPRERVAALLAAGEAGPFETTPGRAMKQWAVVLTGPRTWTSLVREALAFAATAEGAPRAKRAPKAAVHRR